MVMWPRDSVLVFTVMMMMILIPFVSSHMEKPLDSYHQLLHHKYGPFHAPGQELNQYDMTEFYENLLKKSGCDEQTVNCTHLCSRHLLTLTSSVTSLVEWNQVATILLYALLCPLEVCDGNSSASAIDYSELLLSSFANGSLAIGEEELERLLEKIEEVLEAEEGEHHGEEEEGEEGEHHDEEEDGGVVKCFGEGIVMHQTDFDEGLNLDEVEMLAGVIVSFLVQGYVLSENCPVLPSSYDVLNSLLTQLGNESRITEEGFESLLENLKLGKKAGAVVEEEEEDGHGHKRSVSRSHGVRKRRSAEPVANQCLSEGSLATVYDLDLENGITAEQFLILCPALIQQQIGNHCVAEPEDAEVEEIHHHTLAQSYGFGALSVLIISLLALGGIIFIPFLKSNATKYVMSFFVALGVGTMMSDAIIHLLPAAMGTHDHAHGGGGVELEEESVKSFVVCAAIYAFFLFETLMSLISPSKVKPSHGHSHALPQIAWEPKLDEEKFTDKKSSSSDGDSERSKKLIVPTVAILIVVGDSLHNILDGLAIGVAFSSSLEDGIATSIAVFCHELPHELGDFAILIKSGVSKVKAILFNVFAACMCFVGFFVGVSVGADEVTRQWIFALTAGMFIYVALVDMLPSMLAEPENGKKWIFFSVHNGGILLGMGLMLVLSATEGSLESLL